MRKAHTFGWAYHIDAGWRRRLWRRGDCTDVWFAGHDGDCWIVECSDGLVNGLVRVCIVFKGRSGRTYDGGSSSLSKGANHEGH